MVIDNLKNGDRGHLAPIEASVLLFRDRIMRRDKDQAVGVVEVARELAFPVSFEFVKVCLREIAQIIQACCRSDLLKAEEILLGPKGSEFSLSIAVIVGAFSEEILFECYVHDGRLQQKVNRNGELIL